MCGAESHVDGLNETGQQTVLHKLISESSDVIALASVTIQKAQRIRLLLAERPPLGARTDRDSAEEKNSRL